MKQVVQGISGGKVRVVDVPLPEPGASEVLVSTLFSAISPGTEMSVTHLAQSNLLQKAKARPDLVKQVINKAKADGARATLNTVKAKLDSDLPLGYSGCGIAEVVGEAVSMIRPGDLVATGGAGAANHAEYQVVPGLLCVKVPEGVKAEAAALATIGAISLHGFRLSEVQTGSTIVVVGLGLIGQLALRIALASGVRVVGIDIDQRRCDLASKAGALGLLEKGSSTSDVVMDFTRGRGADAVLLCAGGKTNETIRRTPELCRDRASVVVVGDVSLDGERTPFYMKELSLRVARSYGPGRYERSYEEWAIDYPLGYVRWSEGRNIEAVLDLMESGSLEVDDLISHRFDIKDATKAYDLIESDSSSNPTMSVLLNYPKNTEIQSTPLTRVPTLRGKKRSDLPTVALIGSGAYSVGTLVPRLKLGGFGDILAVNSATGLSAKRLVDRLGSGRVASSVDEILEDDSIDCVIIATPHESHANLVTRALNAKKHVWCEKPLALSLTELNSIEDSLENNSDSILWVGFNRRFSRPIRDLQSHFTTHGSELVLNYRVSAGKVPSTHWYNDRKQGGRLLGEVCHFIDTISAVVGETPCDIRAWGSGNYERLLVDQIGVALSFPNGSIGVISYGTTGHQSTPKERLEVLGRGKSGLIDDFRSIELNGSKHSIKPQDKGQSQALKAFSMAIKEGLPTPSWVMDSSRATILASATLSISLASGDNN